MSLLIIILVVGILVQVVPVTRGLNCSKNSKPVNPGKLEHYHCALRTLYYTAKELNSTLTIQLPGSDIITNTNLAKVFEKFSEICKKFTKAMSLKHYVQEYMLNETGPVLNSSQIESFSSTLVSLQTIANILDDIEFIEHKRRCVTLTETHYEKIYHVQYNGALLDQMIKQLGDWMLQNKYCVPGQITKICNETYPYV